MLPQLISPTAGPSVVMTHPLRAPDALRLSAAASGALHHYSPIRAFLLPEKQAPGAK
jgi:hypothetical protein